MTAPDAKPVLRVGDLLIDYSAGVPSARAVKDAGYRGAVRYTSPPRDTWMLGKPIKRAEADDYAREGLALVSNWQFGKRDFDGGAGLGSSHAKQAMEIHKAAGGPDRAPIYFSIDANPFENNSVQAALDYLRGAQEVIGKDRMGVYCNYKMIDACIGAGIGTFFWQHNWGSEGKLHPGAHIHQFEIDKAKVDGIGIDKNSVKKDRVGAWGEYSGVTTTPTNPTSPPVTTRSPFPIIDALGAGVGFTKGHAPRVRVYFHTTENQDWITDAWNVARYQAGAQNGSYHYLIDDNKILNTVSIHDTAWGVLSDNPRSVQVALVMTSGAVEQWSGANPNQESRPKSREQWLKHTKMLDQLGFLVSLLSKSENIPIERVDIVGVGQNRKGFSSHNNYTYGSRALLGYKDGTHWDVPDTFPYDYVFAVAREYLGQPTLPPAPVDPDAYPLAWTETYKEYWGPLDGPQESVSNLFGNESQASKDGLKRWQSALGIPATGVYDQATRDAAARMQQLHNWPITGFVWKGEWEVVIKHGWRFP